MWLSWLERHSIDQRVTGSMSGQGTYPGCRFDPQLGHLQQRTSWCFSHWCFSLCLSLPLSLKAVKKVLGWGYLKKKILGDGPDQVLQLVRPLSWFVKVVCLIPGQGTYKKQPMNAKISRITNWCLSPSLFLSPQLPLSLSPFLWKKQFKKRFWMQKEKP